MNKSLVFSVISIWSLIQLPANAADENFDVYVFADAKYDDNVFRVANDAEALAQNGTTTQGDIELTYGVGANVKIPVSRQQFNVDAELRRTQFDRFDQLDNNNGEITGEWEWSYASRASGELGYKYERALTDFFELQQAVDDTEVEQDIYGRASIPIHPRWTVVLGASLADVSFDERPELDREENSYYGELLFKTRVKTFVGLRIRESETEFDSNATAIEDFEESEASLVVRYESTSKSRISASLGRTEREPEGNTTNQDFTGTTGRISYLYILSGKTEIDFEVFRETTQLNEVTGLVVSRGASIEPKWKISPRTTFRGLLAYEERDFEDTLPVRSDELFTLSARVVYKLNRALSLDIGGRFRSRDSNVDLSEFDQSEISAGLRFRI